MSRPDRHYQKIEYGQVNVPATTLCALADYFGVSTDYLLGRHIHLAILDFLVMPVRAAHPRR